MVGWERGVPPAWVPGVHGAAGPVQTCDAASSAPVIPAQTVDPPGNLGKVLEMGSHRINSSRDGAQRPHNSSDSHHAPPSSPESSPSTVLHASKASASFLTLLFLSTPHTIFQEVWSALGEGNAPHFVLAWREFQGWGSWQLPMGPHRLKQLRQQQLVNLTDLTPWSKCGGFPTWTSVGGGFPPAPSQTLPSEPNTGTGECQEAQGSPTTLSPKSPSAPCH